jgi:ABC-type polysaccharide/polyol phosphate export permease
MIKHFISMILACGAVLGFMQVTDGIWKDIDWLSVFILYGSIIPFCVWVTMLAMAKGGNNQRR